MIDDLRRLYRRELDSLVREIALYPDDAAPWQELAGLPNLGGTLVLHLAGNLRHFIGAQLGHSGYVRHREAEFATRGVSRAELATLIGTTQAELDATFAALDPARLDEVVELPNGTRTRVGLFLLHLLSHLSFHLGQIDYHRRAVTRDATGAGVLPLAALAVPES